MKILVTGGAGFIGSNIVEGLIENEVVVLDDFSLGSVENLENVKDIVTLIKGDVRKENDIKKAGNVDVIFHEAAASSSPMFDKDPRNGYAVNVDGFLNILEFARKNDAKVIYASTSSIYGSLPIPHSESAKVEPPNFYAASLYARENIAKLYSDIYGLETIGLRYFSVYGPHEKAKGRFANTVSQFLWSMKKGKSPIIYGDGSQTRDFIFVKDVVKANLLAMEKAKRLSGEVFNVGSGVAKSFNDVVKILNSVLGKNIKPKYVENPIKNYVYHTLADTKKAKEKLGFEAKVTLEEGINIIKDLP